MPTFIVFCDDGKQNWNRIEWNLIHAICDAEMIYAVYISENITDVDGHWCFPAPMTNFKHNASIVALCKFECLPLSLLFSHGP